MANIESLGRKAGLAISNLNSIIRNLEDEKLLDKKQAQIIEDMLIEIYEEFTDVSESDFNWGLTNSAPFFTN